MNTDEENFIFNLLLYIVLLWRGVRDELWIEVHSVQVYLLLLLLGHTPPGTLFLQIMVCIEDLPIILVIKWLHDHVLHFLA